MSDARQKAHPNLKQGGRHARSGRKPKTHRDEWAKLRDDALSAMKAVMASISAEVAAAKKKGRAPMVDVERLLKIAETATKNAEGGKTEREAVPPIAPADLDAMADRVYGAEEDDGVQVD